MGSLARVRRRSRNLSNEETSFSAEKEKEDTSKEVDRSGVQSNARARRRARIVEEMSRQGYPSLSHDWGPRDISFELLKQTMESYSAERVEDVPPIRASVPVKDIKLKHEGIRFSDDADARGLENKKEEMSVAQLNKMKGYLLARDSVDVMKAKSSENYKKLNQTSLEKSLMGDGSDNFNGAESSAWFTGKENYSHVKVLATLLPDEILKDVNAVDPKEFYAAVMFADVSGFTELSERFDKTGKGGPSRLTEILNERIGTMIQFVLSRRGDVCQFGGDAILCFWKAASESNLKTMVCSAIDVALEIQKNCLVKSEFGVSIKIKISIAAGEVMFSPIGESNRKYYVLVGSPVIETNRSEKLCQPGDVIVSPSAWKYVPDYLFYAYSLHPNRIHITVQDFGPLWVKLKGGDSAGELSRLSLRSSLGLTRNLKLEDIRPFILPFVMKCIDNNEPLDYLTEMRQVATVFLKFDINALDLSSREAVEFCDKAYRCVCNIVDRADGIVNKLNCFDKDVSILIVFGLRGFKYELASKVALKCAYNCVEKVKTLHDVSVSAGVTTGMAYCGVIGHLLRREYTVMGLPVNKAARLMCAYENIVSCDRETFLQSKLESAHFEVLPQKKLKGIRNVGPVYEFSLSVKRRTLLGSYTQPLLGRSKEIEEFEEFLKDYRMENSIINFFIVYGGARIGKTRLISTFVHIAEKYLSESDDMSSTSNSHKDDWKKQSNVEVCFIPLTEEDYKTSYSTVRLIFQPTLGLSETSTPEEREEKIVSKLGDLKDNYFLATLNNIFNVKFHFSRNYLSMNSEEQFIAKRVMKKRLYKVCFPSHSKWVIVIDDAEFIDEASWLFLKWCCTISNYPLFLMTIGQQKELSASAYECLLSIPQKKVVLTELDKWFYTALACQILEVKAIPVELESLLQGFKSSGNPGWLECYLQSLFQTECLQISYVQKREISKMKLVAATDGNQFINSSGHNLFERTGNANWLDWAKPFQANDASSFDIVPVCVLGPNFVDTNNESELTMDIMHVKTIDQLKPLEQLILKAGSVLGYNFKRDALHYLISKEVSVEERTFAKAIKNLFELRILSCDKGDFTCPSSLVMYRRVILNENFQKDIKCTCIGLEKSEALQNLPDYAGCGFMRFRSPVFKDTVYNLLLDEQKKNFHNLSIKFLRNNTYKCKACHSVLFERLFGIETGNELCLVCAKTPMHGVRSTKMTVQGPYIKPLSKTASDEDDVASTYDLSDESSLLNSDISDCQCPQILCYVYAALLEHAERAGRKDIMLEVSFEYASVCLTSYNIPLTAQILEKTQALAEAMREENEYPDLCTPFIFAKIYTLMGATNLNMGRTDNVLRLLEMALKYLGKKVPKMSSEINFQIKRVNLEKRFITECFPNRYIGKASEKRAAYLDLLSECLGLLCMVHMYTANWPVAKLTSTWALNCALRSHRNFFGLCTSYANMMDVAYHTNDKATSSKMETFAVAMYEHCSKHLLEIYELEAIARLYTIVFRARHRRAEIEDAISIGFKSIRIATIIRNSRLRLDLMPELIFALVQRSRLSEAVALLQELESASAQYCDKLGRIWYYALCMDFQLDTGYTIIPYKACEQFVNEEEENFTVFRSLSAAERLCTSMWLWCIRTGEWEASKRYASLLRHQRPNEKPRTPTSVYTKLKKLEGLLITLAEELKKENIRVRGSIGAEISTALKNLGKDVKIVPLLRPRYLLLKAYYLRVKSCRSRNADLLHQARSLAEKIGDQNTVDWITHNKLVWKNATSPSQKSFWLDHCKYENFIDWHEADSSLGKEAVLYSLPVPEKFKP